MLCMHMHCLSNDNVFNFVQKSDSQIPIRLGQYRLENIIMIKHAQLAVVCAKHILCFVLGVEMKRTGIYTYHYIRMSFSCVHADYIAET